MAYESLAFAILGLAVLIHVGFVTVTLGVGLITAIYRYLAYKRKDSYLEAFSRRTFRLLAVSELVSGVWGTIITVVMAGFFPNLVALATNVLFTPIAISIASIMIRIPSIAIFWYTWGRLNPRIHSLLGFIMAISGFGVPLGFRTIFAEITAPHAVESFLATRSAEAFQAYTNPLFWALYAHTVFAALSVGGFIALSVSILDDDVKGVKLTFPYAVGFLLLQPVAGLAYYLLLTREASYIADRITFGVFAPVFALKLILVAALIYLSLLVWKESNSGSIPPLAKYSGPLALFIAILGEFMNDASRHPYMVVTDSTGIHLESFFNYFINVEVILPVIIVILLFLITSLAIFSLAAYYALIRRFVV